MTQPCLDAYQEVHLPYILNSRCVPVTIVGHHDLNLSLSCLPTQVQLVISYLKDRPPSLPFNGQVLRSKGPNFNQS
jgi:hypothetical protein